MPLNRARELLTKGQLKESIGILTNYRPRVEELSEYHYIYAKVFEKSKMFQDYIDHLRLAYIYSTEEKRPSILLERAEAYMKIGYYSEASLIYRTFLKNYSTHREVTRAHMGLGESLYNLGLFEEAAHHFSKAGDKPEALCGRAKSLQAAGKIIEANEAFKALEKDKGLLRSSEDVIYRFGENLMMMKRYDEAKGYLRMIKSSPLMPKAQLLLGIISREGKRYDEALRHLNSAFTSGDRGTKMKALYEIALLYGERGEKKKTLEKLEDLRYNFPYGKVYDDALLRLARLYRESGDNDRAVKILEELLFRRSPLREAIDEFESMILSVADKDKEALLRLWNMAGKWILDPQRSSTVLRVARAFRYSGTPFIRVTSWLLKNGDNNAKEKASLLLAGLYADYGEPVKAEEHLKRADKRDEDYHRIKAKVLLLKADPRGAMDSLLAIKGLKAEDLRLITSVMDSLKETDQRYFKRLLEVYKKVVYRGSLRDMVHLADLLYDSGDKENALKYYKMAIERRDAKEPQEKDERDWAFYRINRLTQDNKVIPMIEGDRLKRLGDLLLKEAEIDRTVREVL